MGLSSTNRKKAVSLIMAELTKYFGLGVKYPHDRFKVEDVQWLAVEHLKPDADAMLDKLIKMIEK